MGDLTKILDGNVGEVKDALAGKSHVDLLELRKQEEAGKNRAGVLSAINAALAPEAAGSTGDGASATETVASAIDQQGAVNPGSLDAPEDNGIAAAEIIDTAGAPQQIVPDVDMSHPAVDADPRANTTDVQNKIDFNDPSRAGVDVVTERLANND